MYRNLCIQLFLSIAIHKNIHTYSLYLRTHSHISYKIHISSTKETAESPKSNYKYLLQEFNPISTHNIYIHLNLSNNFGLKIVCNLVYMDLHNIDPI